MEQTEDGYKVIVSGSEDYSVEIVYRKRKKLWLSFVIAHMLMLEIIASICRRFYSKLSTGKKSR